jgi:hypothetical protein
MPPEEFAGKPSEEPRAILIISERLCAVTGKIVTPDSRVKYLPRSAESGAFTKKPQTNRQLAQMTGRVLYGKVWLRPSHGIDRFTNFFHSNVVEHPLSR